MISLHPAAVLSLWAGAAVFFQSLEGDALWWALAGALAIAAGRDPARLMRLLRRIRVLLLATVLMFGLATPGTRVFAPGVPLPLTFDGLVLGAAHMGRLVMMVAFVAWLMSMMSPARLIEALRTLLSVLSPLGVSPLRIAVRLSLVLQTVDRRGGHWRDWFAQAEAASGPATVRLEHFPFGRADGLVLAGVVAFFVLWSLA